jgi:hypothetical protein
LKWVDPTGMQGEEEVAGAVFLADCMADPVCKALAFCFFSALGVTASEVLYDFVRGIRPDPCSIDCDALCGCIAGAAGSVAMSSDAKTLAAIVGVAIVTGPACTGTCEMGCHRRHSCTPTKTDACCSYGEFGDPDAAGGYVGCDSSCHPGLEFRVYGPCPAPGGHGCPSS